MVWQQAVGQRSETAHRANLSAIARELHAHGRLSRSALVARTGLTRTTIRGLIGEFAAAELVSEERPAPLGVPGRPSPLVRLEPEGGVVLALEIAVDSLAAAYVGLGGVVIDRIRVDRPRAHLSVDEIGSDLAALAGQLRLPQRARGALMGIGVAVVGIVRRSDGFVSVAPNLGWRDVPLGARLARALQTNLPINVANEADLGALAEHRRGAGVGAEHLLFVSGEVGVGGGMIVAGAAAVGAAGYGGEIGHMPVNPTGVACGCGSSGCWETEVGERALLALAGRDPSGGAAEVDGVLGAAQAGDARALAALDSVGRWLGIGLAGLVNLLDPERIILGGLFGRVHPYVARRIEEELDRRALAAPRQLVRVVPARLGIDAPLIGAAELALQAFLDDPAAWLRPRRPTAAAGQRLSGGVEGVA
ncbi:MAG TPA: ROK family protein [Candidatus Limnocylindrales bacterium]|nr:ROK family protein [Candidatus Limnocylindrales bacterium]